MAMGFPFHRPDDLRDRTERPDAGNLDREQVRIRLNTEEASTLAGVVNMPGYRR